MITRVLDPKAVQSISLFHAVVSSNASIIQSTREYWAAAAQHTYIQRGIMSGWSLPSTADHSSWIWRGLHHAALKQPNHCQGDLTTVNESSHQSRI